MDIYQTGLNAVCLRMGERAESCSGMGRGSSSSGRKSGRNLEANLPDQWPGRPVDLSALARIGHVQTSETQ